MLISGATKPIQNGQIDSNIGHVVYGRWYFCHCQPGNAGLDHYGRWRWVASLQGFSWSLHSILVGDTRLGLMWSCMTLYNRPQVCFTPDLQPEWLLALVCIFVGCICITTTIILLASSHWDRNVVPYARWVGFTASNFHAKILNSTAETEKSCLRLRRLLSNTPYSG